MCGIAGKIDFAQPVMPELIHRMCAAMTHRGPDSRGVLVRDGVGLGMQRLAIIDVAGGDQPIYNESNSVAVVLNGEIYNFRELRAALTRRGHRFRTNVDTEVIVHLYEERGERLVDDLRGMFAFAIWDFERERLVLARDRVGKKPLFFSQRGSSISFASEMVSLLQDRDISREVDLRAISSYLTFGYVPDPLCAFADVEKLPPATTLVIDKSGSDMHRYWSLDYSKKHDGLTRIELAKQLRQLIVESTRLRMVSEVPLGAFLSGGIDSSAIVAAMAEHMSEPVKTFSIGFSDAAFDELAFARIVAERFDTEHHEFRVEPAALHIMPKLARHYGEPYADPSAIPSFYLAELTSRHVTVALNGDGGDESFAGYNRYVQNLRARRLDSLPPRLRSLISHMVAPIGEGRRATSLRSRVQRAAAAIAMDPAARYVHWVSAFPRKMREDFFARDFLDATSGWSPEAALSTAWTASTADDDIDRMLDIDIQSYLPGDLLVKMDIATMAYSVEARSPFLDHELMEFAAAIPTELKLHDMSGKTILKDALRGWVPDKVLDRPKMGFGVPLSRWFREELRELPQEVLLDGKSNIGDYVRPSAVQRMLNEHQDGSADHSLRIWTMLQLEFWHREVVDLPGRCELSMAEVSQG